MSRTRWCWLWMSASCDTTSLLRMNPPVEAAWVAAGSGFLGVPGREGRGPGVIEAMFAPVTESSRNAL